MMNSKETSLNAAEIERLGEEVITQPCTVWLTGLSGAGKSTLAYGLAQQLSEARKQCYVLDGDVLRNGLCRDLSFSAEDRSENIRRVAEVARLMNEAGVIVIA